MNSVEALLNKSKKQMMKEFGMQPPPIATHKAVPELMIASWSCLRESLVVGDAPRYKKEVLAAAVSQKNDCPYCVQAHNMMAKSLAPADISKRTDLEDQIVPAELAPIYDWVQKIDIGNLNALSAMPAEFSPQDEYLATYAIFSYLNRFVSVYHEDDFLPKIMQTPAKWMMPVASLMMKSIDEKAKVPGQSVILETDETAILFSHRPAIQKSYQQMHKAVNDLISPYVSPAFIEHFNQQISTFHLKPIGNLDNQVNEVINDIPVNDGFEADLMPLLVCVAFAPKTINKQTLAQMEKKWGKSEVMIAVSWAAFMTSLYIVNELARHLYPLQTKAS